METNGETPADRLEAVLSAIYYTLRLLAATQGVQPDSIERYAGDVELVRPQRYVEPTQEELDARWNNETRRGFAGMLAKAKQALAKGEDTMKI